MVIATISWQWDAAAGLAYAEKSHTLLERLDPATRARVLAALAGLVILGFGMVLLAWLGARMTRRYMRRFERQPGTTARPTDALMDDWAYKPLVPKTKPQGEKLPDD